MTIYQVDGNQRSIPVALAILSNRIKELREGMNLTQAELAKLTDQDITTVNKHENSERGIQPYLVKAYARVFKVDTYEIFVDPTQLPQ